MAKIEEDYPGQAASKRWKDNNREHVNEKSREWYRVKTKSKEGYVQLHLQRCKSNTKDTDVDYDFLLSISDRCALTGTSFTYGNKYKTFSNPLAPSVDRIDSDLGYYKDSIQVVLNCINKMKNDMPNEDFKELWKELIK